MLTISGNFEVHVGGLFFSAEMTQARIAAGVQRFLEVLGRDNTTGRHRPEFPVVLPDTLWDGRNYPLSLHFVLVTRSSVKRFLNKSDISNIYMPELPSITYAPHTRIFPNFLFVYAFMCVYSHRYTVKCVSTRVCVCVRTRTSVYARERARG